LPDQPNRAVRTRMLRGVGGGSCEASPYPDMPHMTSITPQILHIEEERYLSYQSILETRFLLALFLEFFLQ